MSKFKNTPVHLACLAAFILLAAAARAERLPARLYRTSDGLAQDRVKRIVRDARGFLWFCTADGLSRESLSEAVSGGAPMWPQVARRVITFFRDFRPPKRADYDLTPHETRLLRLLVEGHNYKTAAFGLGVAVNTVSFHLKKIYEKLQVHSKSETVAEGVRLLIKKRRR